MAVFGNIPLPGNGNEAFKDVMDYFEEIQKRRAQQNQAQAKLKQDQEQFGITNQLDRDRLAEMANYHKNSLTNSGKFDALKAQLLQAKIIKALGKSGKELSAQERTEAMKLLSAARTIQGVDSKAEKLEKLLNENPDLTGWIPGAKGAIGKGGDKLGEFTSLTGDLQAAISRIASQRGGAQVLKFAGKIKPTEFKDSKTNLGHIKGIRDSNVSDWQDIADEYKAITGEELPLKMARSAHANHESGKSSSSVTKEHVTEENIEYTMKETGLSREEVMKRLKAKGLI